MPAFFVKISEGKRGIVVSDKPLVKKEVTFKGGHKRTLNVQISELKFGFFAVENPEELGYESGEKVPVSITKEKIADENGNLLNICWCNPD